MDCDVAIIGAGVAGLAAAGELARHDKRVCCLEAAGIAGGRIRTIHDPLSPVPLELGAEFVHGRSPAIWKIIHDAGLTAYEHTAKALFIHQGKLQDEKKVGEIADRVLSQLAKSKKRKDESFAEFLLRSHQPPGVKRWAKLYVEGFNAARQELIGTASLRRDAEAAEEIDGDRGFRILNGYDSLTGFLLRSIPEWQSTVRLNSVVERIEWSRGKVALHYRPAIGDRTKTHEIRCRQAVITVPLGVLQAAPPSGGAIRFDPEPGQILEAARKLEFGQAYRVTFRFAEAFWEKEKRFQAAGFLISTEKLFPTWWTSHPLLAPVLTGWTAGSAADELKEADRPAMIAQAMSSLRRILKRKIPDPEAIYFHDWRADPFIRGAYSYAPVNALPARKVLSRPVDNTLFLAGEATETTGNAAMVHGAIMTGIKAARSALNV